MWFSRIIFNITALCIWLIAIGCTVEAQTMKGEKYFISAEEDAISEQWAEYLYNHLAKRSNDPNIVKYYNNGSDRDRNEKNNVKNIHFEVANDLENDYCIAHTSSSLHIRAKDRKTAIWLIYQLIDAISLEDNRIDTSDLPPSIINFNTSCKDFDFNYREPFFSSNLLEDYAPIIGTNSVDTDWGLWGHNLSKTIEYRGDDQIYALVDGERNKSQFCFTSKALFDQIEEYVIDNFGFSENYSNYFMIMPNDNNMSCTCPSCLQVGNNSENATPAVHNMITKLAERFPMHQFYTSAYYTTVTPPAYHFPENSGVFFSTIDLPKGVVLDQQSEVKQFLKQIKEWRTITDNIYLWDYTANFDDYLTPIPVLLGLQAQLQFFKKEGIKGVFLNAGGYDYIPFDDLKTFVAGALMIDVNSNVEELIESYFEKTYPQNHELLNNYYIDLEKSYFKKNKPYNIYGSMQEAINTYFDIEKFIHFYEELHQTATSQQDQLLTALTYTRLQIAYTQGSSDWGYASAVSTNTGNLENTLGTVIKKSEVKPEVLELIEKLREHTKFENLQNYKEFDGSLFEYIKQWENLINTGPHENILLNKPIAVISKKDENFQTTELLTDGTPGFTNDYHQGWYLSSGDDLEFLIPPLGISEAKLIQLRFLNMERHGIYPPTDIVILKNNEVYDAQDMNVVYEGGESNPTSVIYNIPVSFNKSDEIKIQIKRVNKPKNTLALDEVRLLN